MRCFPFNFPPPVLDKLSHDTFKIESLLDFCPPHAEFVLAARETCADICVCVYIYIHTHTDMDVRMDVPIRVCMYECMYVCMYVHACMHVCN